MIELRGGSSRSWLDAKFSRRLAYVLRERLMQRCEGEDGVVITLTYKQAPWRNASELWSAQGEEQHVALFIRKLSRYLAMDLRGKWFCKAEFQENGFVHFHLVVLGPTFIDHGDLEQLWGRGFVWIDGLDERGVFYVCKYVAKGGSLPSFLLDRQRVRIVRVSNGFWPRDPDDDRPKREPLERKRSIAAYVPIGARLACAEQTTVVRSAEGTFLRLKCSVNDAITALSLSGVKMSGGEHGWMVAECNVSTALHIINRSKSRPPLGERRQPRPGGSFHLIQSHKPDAPVCDLPVWLDELIRDKLQGRHEGSTCDGMGCGFEGLDCDGARLGAESAVPVGAGGRVAAHRGPDVETFLSSKRVA